MAYNGKDDYIKCLKKRVERLEAQNEECWKQIKEQNDIIYAVKQALAKKGQMSLQEFDIFWEKYPMKKGKTDAERHWHRIKPVLSEVMAALELQKQEKEWLAQYKKFVSEWKHGSTWVNQKCWRDGYHPDFEAYLEIEKNRPAREKAALERKKQEIRDLERDYYAEKSTEELNNLDGNLHRKWLINEILQERNELRKGLGL